MGRLAFVKRRWSDRPQVRTPDGFVLRRTDGYKSSYERGGGVGRVLGVTLGRGVSVGLPVGVGVAVGVTLGVVVGVAVAVALGVIVGVAVAIAVGVAAAVAVGVGFSHAPVIVSTLQPSPDPVESLPIRHRSTMVWP